MQPGTTPARLQARVARAAWELSRRHSRVVLVAMLATLHVAAFRGVTDPGARAFLIANLGLVLLWQPFLRGEQRVPIAPALVLAGFAAVAMLWLDWWLLALWVVVLAGLAGGKVYQHHERWQRRRYLLMLVYLLALLAVAILPEIAPRHEITPEVRGYAELGLLLLLALIALVPAEAEAPERRGQVIDFFYSMFLMLVLTVVILGSFTLMTLARTGYLEALTYTVLMVSVGVLLIALVWNPVGGFAGANVFFSRYLFSIGLPPERWLKFLADLSAGQANPERFLAEAVAGLARLPWVSGVAWRAGGASGSAGERTAHEVEFANDALWLAICSRHRMSPALAWHLHLLGQLLAEFYVAKLREEKLRQASYLQAVHETGARLTHDIKNLLQSLNVLCSVAAREEGRDSPELQALVRRQLPAIAQRLAETLEKLHRPQPQAAEEAVPARAWWEALVAQYRGEGVEFEARGLSDGLRVPRALFASVAENLLSNALVKRAAANAVRVSVEFDGEAGPALRVTDTGGAVPPEVAEKLLRAPVASARGLGVGLFQAARQAQAAGYALTLESNRNGEVCFVLQRPPSEARLRQDAGGDQSAI